MGLLSQARTAVCQRYKNMQSSSLTPPSQISGLRAGDVDLVQLQGPLAASSPYVLQGCEQSREIRCEWI